MILIGNKVLTASVKEILERIQYETRLKGDTYLKDIKPTGHTCMVTCPVHKNHSENHPSCGVFTEKYGNFNEGDFHCFTCQTTGTLVELVGICFGYDKKYGEEWLIDRFGAVADIDRFELTDIEVPTTQNILNKIKNNKKPLDSTVLENYNHDYYNEYMWKRKLTKEVVDHFKIGYNPKTEALTFPVWDEKGNYKMMTERSVHSKNFFIQSNVEKPVYLLNYVIGKDYPFVLVTESQLDALTAYVYGVPAIALLGVGTSEQYEILNRVGIREYVTMFDNDFAGRAAAQRFNKNINKNIFVTNLYFGNLKKKDINDLTKDEFDQILNAEGLTFRLKALP